MGGNKKVVELQGTLKSFVFDKTNVQMIERYIRRTQIHQFEQELEEKMLDIVWFTPSHFQNLELM